MRMRKAVLGATIAAAMATAIGWGGTASAFCGFYISGADAKLFNDATQVVLMREGTRTVLSMQNSYKGPPQAFAMVVPVPVVLQKENVKTLPPNIFARVDQMTAPRLVEYWEQDPCMPEGGEIERRKGGIPRPMMAAPPGAARAADLGVTVEAQFTVGEYEIVILSAQDAAALDTWLKTNNYKIPDNAEPALRPYVAAGMKFFVAKVNVAKVKFDASGRATLSPLRFHYDSERFELPVKLGLLNSNGTQDLVVNILAPGQRYQLANYPNVSIPTNLEVVDATRTSFGSFYATLFDRALEKTPGGIVTEYAWGASSCDPCPGDVQGLTQSDLATLGADALPSAKQGSPTPAAPGNVTIEPIQVMGKLPQDVVTRIVRAATGRMRACYERELAQNPATQGKVVIRFEVEPKGTVGAIVDNGSDIKSQNVIQCVIAQVRRMSFPEPENGNVVATMTLRMAQQTPAPAPQVGGGLSGIGTTRVSFSSIASNFVLTRLHARYSRDALGNDLVFKAAPPIVGGRESMGPNGKLEQGAVASSSNSFQARYVIRHPWKGPIACQNPRRGVWGGPWPGSGGTSKPIAAQRTAYVPRGKTSLAAFVPGGVPDVDVLPDPMAVLTDPNAGGLVLDAGLDASPVAVVPDDAGAAGADASPSKPPAITPSRCGCEVVGAGDSTTLVFGGAAAFLASVLVLTRRRSRHTACDSSRHGKRNQSQ